MNITLRPFFSFYGSKNRIIKHYPVPTHDLIIEPFAGSASYSLRYYQKQIILYEIDPIIAGVWSYLTSPHTTRREILNLPSKIYKIDDFPNLIQEQKWLIGFWLNQAVSRPRKTMSKWGLSNLRPDMYWGEQIKDRIGNQIEYIKHWKIINKSYEECPNMEATYFIDPPYKIMGKYYKFNNKYIDYKKLSEWCISRNGEVIVCENEGADWLPFRPFRQILNTRKEYSKEVIYYKE